VVFMRHPKVRVALLRVLLQTVLLCPALKVGVLAFKVMSQIVVKVCGKVALWGVVLQVDMFTAERYSPHHTYGGGGGGGGGGQGPHTPRAPPPPSHGTLRPP
jgi:hypothetical protein